MLPMTALERRLHGVRAVPATVHDHLELVTQADRGRQSRDEDAGHDGMASDDTELFSRAA